MLGTPSRAHQILLFISHPHHKPAWRPVGIDDEFIISGIESHRRFPQQGRHGVAGRTGIGPLLVHKQHDACAVAVFGRDGRRVRQGVVGGVRTLDQVLKGLDLDGLGEKDGELRAKLYEGGVIPCANQTLGRNAAARRWLEFRVLRGQQILDTKAFGSSSP